MEAELTMINFLTDQMDNNYWVFGNTLCEFWARITHKNIVSNATWGYCAGRSFAQQALEGLRRPRGEDHSQWLRAGFDIRAQP